MQTTKPESPIWAKPELVKLGELKDVAGSRAVNIDGQSVNLRDAPVS